VENPQREASRARQGRRVTAETSRAIVYTRSGGPEVLTMVDRPARNPGPAEVAIRVHRSGVNPTDWKSRQGGGPSAVSGARVPGQDGAGVVVAAGAGVDRSLLGRRVWIWEAAHERADGTAQEWAVVPARQVVPLPDDASFDLGASLGIPYMTAHRCLTVHEEGPLRLGPGALAGRFVLVAGGAGAVGNAAIQLARWSDATVITTVSGEAKAHLAAAAGADHVINYKRQDVVAEVRRINPKGIDSIVEVSPASNAQIDAAVLAQHGSVAIYAAEGGAVLSAPVFPLMVTNGRWQFVFIYTAPSASKSQAVHDIAAAVDTGSVNIGSDAGLPLHHFPLDRTHDAHIAVEHSAVGKVLIDVRD
jgi:NADPH:quinone reductase